MSQPPKLSGSWKYLLLAVSVLFVASCIAVAGLAMRFDPRSANTGQAQQKERQERELKEKIEREVQELREGLEKETNPEIRARLERMLAERLHYKEGGEALSFRENRDAGLAAKWAKVSMEQAIQIALGQNPGTALQSSLIGEREDRVFYHVVILSGEEGNTTLTHVMVNAIDGTIVKTEKETPRTRVKPQ